jgi:hypothetical protein
MNISMPIRNGMFVAWFSVLTEEHERLARFEVLVRVAAELHPGRRFASELCYPAWIGPNTLFLEQGQRAFPATLLAYLLRLAMRSNKKRMDRRQRDRRPGEEGADEPVEVPRRHRSVFPLGNQCWDKTDDERHPDSLKLLHPIKVCYLVHVAASRFDRAVMFARDESHPALTIGDAKNEDRDERDDVRRGNVSLY